MRCDVNVSVHEIGKPFGQRCELKNLNSVKSVVDAIGMCRAMQRISTLHLRNLTSL